MEGKRAFILGISGIIGQNLALELKKRGWEVSGAARFSDPDKREIFRQNGIETAVFDVTRDDPADLPPADVVFLEIWDPTRPDLIWPINYFGVGRVVERYAGEADFVNGCTINVYGATAEQPDESFPCRPDTEYGRSRYSQERLIDYFCERSGSRAIHIRYAHANTAENGIVRRMADAIVAEKSLGPNPDERLQVIGLEDFVRVTAEAVNWLDRPPAIVNCCHPRVWTKRELAEALHERLGYGKVIFDRETGGLEESVYADSKRMIDWFGEPQVSVETILQRVADRF